MSERLTEDIVETLLVKLGYRSNSNCFIEKQESSIPRIQKLLKNASKSGKGVGRPEFIISFKDDIDFLIVIECKADLSRHESKNRDRYAEYAVDGVLLYSNYLSKDFNVMAIAVSGKTEQELKVSHFLQLRGAYVARSINDKQLLDYDSYKTSFQTQTKPLRNEELVKKAIEYNEILHKHSVPETERNTLISTILIALQDSVFVRSFHEYEKNIELIDGMLIACNRVLGRNDISDSRQKTILHEYSGILHNQKLISEVVKDKKQRSPNVILKNLISDLKNSVLPFIQENDFDILGRFYREFIRYAGGDAKTGLVLTPTHITDFFCDIADLQHDDVVYDPCCGTGGFLVSAMKYMLNRAGNNIHEWKEIKWNRLIGIEIRADMFTHACSNMMMRGDGKSNIYNGNCFDDEVIKKVKQHKPNKGFLNPPYDVGSAGQLEFVEHTLECLVKGGQCVAICQMSTAIKQDKATLIMKERLLSHHTLNAVFSMPDQLFYPKGVITSVLVFTAHVPHSHNKEVFFGYFKDDGHILRKHKGRIDSGSWINKKESMLNLYINKKSEIGLAVTKCVTGKDEWCAEAYMETDYSNLTESAFLKTVKDYVAFLFLHNLIQFVSPSAVFASDEKIVLNRSSWKNFRYDEIFKVEKGYYNRKPEEVEGGDIPFVGATEKNNGVTSLHNLDVVDISSKDGSCKNHHISKKIFQSGKYITISNNGSVGYAFFQPKDFTCSHDVNPISLLGHEMNEYIAMFLCTIIGLEKYRWAYGRKWRPIRMKESIVRLPTNNKGTPNWGFMERYIKSLPFSSVLRADQTYNGLCRRSTKIARVSS